MTRPISRYGPCALCRRVEVDRLRIEQDDAPLIAQPLGESDVLHQWPGREAAERRKDRPPHEDALIAGVRARERALVRARVAIIR